MSARHRAQEEHGGKPTPAALPSFPTGAKPGTPTFLRRRSPARPLGSSVHEGPARQEGLLGPKERQTLLHEGPPLPEGLLGRRSVMRRRGRPGTIQGRMARMMVVPLATTLGLLGFIIFGEVQSYRAAAAVSDGVRLTLGAQDVVHELQRERGLTNGLLGGESRFRSDVDNQRPRTDKARAALDLLVQNRDVPGESALRSALDLLVEQASIRRAVDNGAADRGATFDFYTRAIDALGGLEVGTEEIADTELRRHLSALQALGYVKESSAKERGFLSGIFATGHFGGDEYARFADIRGAKQAALTQFERYATAEQRARADAALRSSAAAIRSSSFESAAIAAADGRTMTVDSRVWWDAMTVLVDDLRSAQQAVGADAEARATDLRGRATTQLFVLLGLAGLVSLTMLGVARLLVVSARSITEPLARLAREADDVASRRLPDAVALIQSTDKSPPPLALIQVPERAGAEIRQVAQALDRVQQVAHTLATEQALVRRNTTESLASLGRRNQNLLRRQLGFISQLEREEADPNALANLFELDHLATRMRRNAESLLVLVGEASLRRWSAPLPVADVIRAAIAEVEDYRRVEMRRIDNAFVAGAVVTDIAHVVAELVENGLAFSPPELNVEIYGRWTGTDYLIAIVDQGVGMTNEDLAVANSRLRGEENFLLGPARFLGHYVVGRLAKALTAAVQLAHSPVTGITARIMLPAAVVGPSVQQTEPQPPADAEAHDRAERPHTSAQPQPGHAVGPPSAPWQLRRPSAHITRQLKPQVLCTRFGEIRMLWGLTEPTAPSSDPTGPPTA